ncbi:hypothetical protein C8J55DRAFT_192284 [Lentinula edodes]|uniref:Zinc-finger domain-containing protein n=1 Tax=Lentinula lateritia TaxID=40482 RepID=A0A9W9DGP8_9AGAR|nr:hypothetical protein C8J55DRAFT_192284 [Lentinula edodes]
MKFTSYSSLSNWDGDESLFQPKSTLTSKTSSTRNSPQSVPQNESTSECTPLEVAALKQLLIHQDVSSSEPFSALEKCANIPNLDAIDKEAESVDTDTETAVATNMSESINSSLFTPPRRESISPLSPSSSLDGASLFSPRESPKSSTSTLSPLRQQTENSHQQEPGEKFDPESYHGHGTGTLIFLSHIQAPLLPRDTTHAHYLEPHPKVLEKITKFSSPSVLFQDSPSPAPFGSHHKKAPPRPNVYAPSTSALPSSSLKQHTPMKYTNLQDALNASTIHNAEDDYIGAFIDKTRPVVRRKQKQSPFDGVHLPRKKARLNPSTVAAPSSGNSSVSVVVSQNLTTTKSSYIPGDIMLTDKTRGDGDGYVRLFVGRHMDFISGASWLKNAHESTIPNSSSKQKRRDHRMLLVKDSNTRHIGVKNHRQGEVQNLGTKRGLPPGLNSCSTGLMNWKGKDRMLSSSKRNSGSAERMFASIFAPETAAGYWIVQNSDEEFPGDETDDEDDLPYLDLSEVHKVRASSSYSSVNTAGTAGTASRTTGKMTMPLPNPNPKPKTQPHGTPQSAPSSVPGGPSKSSSLKAQYPDPGNSYESFSMSSASYSSVSASTSFSLPISTPSWSASSLSAQPLRKSYSQTEPHKYTDYQPLSPPVKAQQFPIQRDAISLNLPGPSEKALGKRKAFDDGVKPHVKRGRPRKHRPPTVLANSSMSQYHGHVSHTPHDPCHAQNLYEAQDSHLIPDSVGQHELFSRTSAVSASGPSEILGGPRITDNLVKIPSSQGNQNGHIYQFYSPHAHVRTSTRTNAYIPGLTSLPPIVIVGNPFSGDGAESGVESEATIGQTGHDEPDTHCDDLKWAAEKFLVLLQNDPQQAKDVIEMLQLQRPGQTIATGNTLPQPQSNGSLDGFLNMPGHDVGIGQEITKRNFSVHGDHRGVDVGEWLIPSFGMGRILEAGDQAKTEIEPGLYSGLSRSSRAGIEISTPDHPVKHTSMSPDASSNATINPSILFSVEDEHVTSDGLDILNSSERVYYSGDPLPPRGKQRMISVQPKARKRRNTDSQSSATSPVPQPPPPLLQSNALSLVLDYGSNSDSEEKDNLHEDSLDFDVHLHTIVSALSATPATLASPSTVSSSLKESQATINNGVDVISIESGSGLQKGGERSPTSRLTIPSPNKQPSPKLRLSDSAALEVPRSADLSQKATGREKEKKKKKQAPANRRNWPLGSSEYFCHQCRSRSFKLHMACAFDNCNLKYCIKCITVRYADLLAFDTKRKDFSCFRCTNNCRCDLCCRKRGEIYIPPKRNVQLASDNEPEPPELMTLTQRRQRRKNANRKEMDLELETKEIEDRTISESAGPSGENTIAERREKRDKVKGKAKMEPEIIASTEKDTAYEKETGEKAALTKNSWPEGPLEYYCHQCRHKSFRLYMECASEGCNAKYCIRCVTSRYASTISFDSTRDDFFCFRCKDTCLCDKCCSKRGEIYISFRRPSARPTTFKPAHLRSRQSEERPYPKLAPITVDTQVSHPVVYWGAVYNWTGEVIASAYVASVENDGVIFARPLRKRRVFIGDVQPDWELGSNFKVRYLGESRENLAQEPVVTNDDMPVEPGPTTSKRKILYVGKPPPPSSDISASPAEPMVSGMGNSAAHPVNVDEFESQAESMSIDDIADQSVVAHDLGASFSETGDSGRKEVLASSHSAEREAYKPHFTHNPEGPFRSPATKEREFDINGDLEADLVIQPSSVAAEGEISKPLSARDLEAPDTSADVEGMYDDLDVFGDSKTDIVIQISATADEGEVAIGAVTMNCGETDAESLDSQMDYDTAENFHVPYDNVSPTSATEFDTTVLVEDDMFPTNHLSELSVVQDHASHTDSLFDALVNDEAVSEDQEYSNHNLSVTTDTHPNFKAPFENNEFPLDIGSPLTDLDDDD